MKLTWFGGTTIRIHIGGTILVVDAEGAPVGIDAAELVSGSDMVIAGFGAELPAVDTVRWKPRKPPRLLDEGDVPAPVEAWRAREGALLVDAIGEAPLLLLAGMVPAVGRWGDGAVVVLFGNGAKLISLGQSVLDDAPPRLIALAGEEAAIDLAIPALQDRLDGTGLVALEVGMALEI